MIHFSTNAAEYHIGWDQSADDLVIGKGTALGTDIAVSINDDLDVGIGGNPALGPRVRIWPHSTADHDNSATFMDGANGQTNTITGNQDENFGWNFRNYTVAGDSGTRTVAEGATVYIPGAITVGSNAAVTANYALFVDDGASRFDGFTGFGTGTTVPTAFVEAIDTNTMSIMAWDGTNDEGKIGFFHTLSGAPGSGYLVHNSYFNGSAWAVFDSTYGSHNIAFHRTGALTFGAIASGGGEPTVRMQIKATGEIDLQSNALGLTNVGNAGNDWTARSIEINQDYDGSLSLYVKNTSDDAAGNAHVKLQVSDADAGDAFIHMQAVSESWSIGVDNSASDRFAISNTALLGGADAMRIATDGETTFDNVGSEFTPDYVCDGCGRAEIESFECCGTVAWHDDVLALREMKLSQSGIDQMVKLGVYELDGPDDADPGWTGINFQKAMHFTWAGMYQNRERMDDQNEAMDARLKRIEHALGV
jgi:hypothetical protein